MLKQAVMAAVLGAALTPSIGVVQAADAAPDAAAAPAAPATPPEHTITGNVGFFSQYIFRGLTQTNRDPALQGGFDYAHSSGFYLGTWASNISWLKDGGTYSGGGGIEGDFYRGFKLRPSKGPTVELGTTSSSATRIV